MFYQYYHDITQYYCKLNIPCIITVIFALAVCITPPALFVETQVYTVVVLLLVGMSSTCKETLVAPTMALLFLYHCTVGVGNPSAVHKIDTSSPTLTVYGDCGLMVIIGASVENRNAYTILSTNYCTVNNFDSVY